MMLASLYQLPQIAKHTPREISWDSLPNNCIIQLHWNPTPSFKETLKKYNFKVLVLVRHPLDVLLSIWQFSQQEPATCRWLDGFCGDERHLHHVDLHSEAFLEYAKSCRAKALLSISKHWLREPNIYSVRYEQLVDKPYAWLEQISLFLDIVPSRADLQKTISLHAIEILQKKHTNGHFWQGRPGHWRELLSPSVSEIIYLAHQELFAIMGYSPILFSDRAN